ncbi:MAG: DUF2892 domain-containing protein [Gammaproteobacteria bacterium]|nr:DUF2892 domain-containing protein [Gammaproteobacteria bacterium]MDH5651951.1 DUF2892 domain-containing protein [Gammaproteobacteria bacterium]
MKNNMCLLDRIVRLILATGAVYMIVFTPDMLSSFMLKAMLVMFGGINLFAGVTGYCVFYTFADFTTLRKT